MELQMLIENLDYENNRYFYHITGKGFGNEIIEEGLSLQSSDIRTTTIEIPEEMIEDPIKYCESEYTNGIVKRQEMVIIGCDKEEIEYMVEKSGISKWMGDEKLGYVISNEYVLGYIDLETLEVVYNPEYKYGGRHV